jgi:hypothetical protein
MGAIKSGNTTIYQIPVDANDGEISLTWRDGKLRFVLVDPRGSVVDPTEVSDLSDSSSMQFVRYSLARSPAGIYKLSIISESANKNDINYLVSSYVNSPRTLKAATDKSLYVVGDKAIITARLNDSNVNISRIKVQASISRNNSIVTTVNLVEQSKGVYSGTYVIPNTSGYLGLSVIAQGIVDGVAFMRQDDAVLAVSPPTVNLTGQYSVNPIDADKNGKYESIDAIIGLEVTKPGNYVMSADLTDERGVMIAHSVSMFSLQPGFTSATLSFNGDDIRRSGGRGRFILTNLTVTDQQNQGVPAIWQVKTLYITDVFNPADFAASCFFLDALVDTANAGKIVADPAPNCNNGLQYTSDSTVKLTINPNVGYKFIGWKGDVESVANTITLKLDRDRRAIAFFVVQTTATPTSANALTPRATVTLTAHAPTSSLVTEITSTQVIVIVLGILAVLGFAGLIFVGFWFSKPRG